MNEVPSSSAGSSSPPASSWTPTGLSSPDLKDVLTEDFRQQCTNLQNQYTRMHGRMQLITGLNTALLPTLGALAVAARRDDVGYGWLPFFPAAGMLLSMIGYVAGANDRHLVDLYRRQLARTAKSLLVSTNVADPETVYKTWAHAGRDPREVSKGVGKPRSSLTSWRWDPVSVTRLPAVLSLVFFFVWLLVILILLVIDSASPEHLTSLLPLVSFDMQRRWSAQWWAGPHTWVPHELHGSPLTACVCSSDIVSRVVLPVPPWIHRPRPRGLDRLGRRQAVRGRRLVREDGKR